MKPTLCDNLNDHLIMELTSHFIELTVLLLLSVSVGNSRDTITPSDPLNEPETLSSNNGMFHLGFFTPTNSSYLGIWYMSNPPVVWVANRDQSIKDSSSALLQISHDGNLVLMDNTNNSSILVWSTNLSNISSNTNTTAQLLNTGNLVLQENTTGRILWQSFQHPSNTLLQKMQLSTNKITGEKVKLTSWRTPQDPSIGDFSLSLEAFSSPGMFLWKGVQPHWRTGPWNGVTFLGIPGDNINNLDGFYLEKSYDDNGTYYLSFDFANQSLLLICVLTADGNMKDYYWDYVKRNWSIVWTAINSECDVYGKCGVFGICDPTSEPICSCLTGFEPKNSTEWSRQNWSSGCVRKKALQCEDNGFVKLENAKTPDFEEWSSPTEYDCRTQCIGNCSCEAYAYDAGIGCMLWRGNLIDIQRFSSGGTDLYIRVADSDLGKKKNNVTVIIAVIVTVGVIVLVSCTFILWKRTSRKDRANSGVQVRIQKNELLELSQYEFERLAIATNNFDLDNKLGQGGFGPVYKGTLDDGQEIAVKRLSRASGQGLEEFMNEVLVISKLQHRNLVRLLGCCIERDEKILIYEYMPNRSLDAYMFDPSNQILSWEKRFDIIEGIARALLYLHRDSRLRIIHRDLKLSNILLDGELNAKISDFGMAKIFGYTEDEANTRRVVGTFGYMPPEYVMEGLFSEKSDVFSFGVLLLEIVSKRKNTSFYEDAESLSLIGFAWKLWNDDKITALIDPEITNISSLGDIMRCIQIGLLCVQELARDRPTMTAVISMLNSETVNLPLPKQPAFMHRQTMLDIESSHRSDGSYSINHMSLTNIQGR